MYTVTLIDIDSYEMAQTADVRNLKEACSIARQYLKDPEYADDASHALIENDNGEVIEQIFGKSNRAPSRDH